jgi:hypothetical protein
VQVMLYLSTDHHPYHRTLQSFHWQSQVIWMVPISNQKISCH